MRVRWYRDATATEINMFIFCEVARCCSQSQCGNRHVRGYSSWSAGVTTLFTFSRVLIRLRYLWKESGQIKKCSWQSNVENMKNRSILAEGLKSVELHRHSKFGPLRSKCCRYRPPSWFVTRVFGPHERHLVVFITVQNLVGIDAKPV